MRTIPHLYFKGDCEAALTFYASVGLGAIKDLRRFGGGPMAERHGALWADKVLHASFEGPGLLLFAGDGPDSEPMKGCALLLEHRTQAEAERCFVALSEGGRITVAFAKQPWGDWYGNFTDRFGVQWAVLCPVASAP